jgi:pyruvate/2-oxoglutarate dehydrogenase complex dihydrolipoamide dehydrogenase (E3) component
MTTRRTIILPPDDVHNRELISHVHPPDYENPDPEPMYNLLVVGLGTAGLVAAVGAASMGARVAMAENYLIGGDCLNFGCVPSKAVIRSSRVMGELQRAAEYGIDIHGKGEADFPRVMERMRRLRALIGRHDSEARLKELGVHLFLGEGRFKDRRSFEMGGKTLRFKRAVIATGARPARPLIPGLEEAGYLTNETVFSLTEKPDRLLVIGGGPIGCELAQAFRRLGSEVTIVQVDDQFLPREDRDAADILARTFEREGIRVLMGATIRNVTLERQEKRVEVEGEDGTEYIAVDEILAAVGRIPNVEGLNLEAAQVSYDLKEGIQVNDFLQTTNRAVYAAGDVCFPYKFTHIADATARIVIQNALFLKSKRHTSLTIPWCTYTDPEVAHVGLYERDLTARGIACDTYVKEFKDVDRAVLDGGETGFVKLHVKKGRDKLLGATVVSSHAGEMISELTQAMVSGTGLKTLNNVIHPYPTHSEAIRQAAAQYYVRKFSPGLKKWLDRWFRWRR